MLRKIKFTALFAGLFFARLAAAQEDDLAHLIAQVRQVNRQLESQPASAGQFAELLETRAGLLVRLMDIDPLAVAPLALPIKLAAQARSVLAAPPLESSGEWTGTLEAAVADDFEHRRSHTDWYLADRGRRLQLHLSATPRQMAGSTVRVAGVSIGGHVAVSAILAFDADSGMPAKQCTTVGPQNIAVLLLTMPSFPSLPAGYDSASLQQLFFGGPSNAANQASLNEAWQEMSGGKTSASGQVFGPIALGQDFDCTDSNGIEAAALNAAGGTVDFGRYTHIAMFFPATACPAYQGKDSQGCWEVQSPNNGMVNTSVGWFPAISGTAPSLGLVTHELGHGLGLGHSSGDTYSGQPLGPIDTIGQLTEYGDPFAVMGIADSGGGYQREQYSGPHQSALGWLIAGEGLLEVHSAGSVRLGPLESQAAPRALRVLRDPLTSSWLWLEYRQEKGDVLVHYDDPNLGPTYTYLLDFNPQSSAGLANAGFGSDTSWSDPYSPLTLSVSNPTLDGVTVDVAYDPPCASLRYSAATFSSAAAGGTITVSASPSCSWSASAGSPWIHLTGATSGQGSGVVTFSVDENTGALQRVAYVMVQRQSVQLLQQGVNLTVLSVSPNYGFGASGQFTFQMLAARGYTDISTIQVRFQAASDCTVRVNQSAGSYGLVLVRDDGSTSGPIPLGMAGQSRSNSVCTVWSRGSGVAGSGTNLRLTLQMSFARSFAGAHRVWGGAFTFSGDNLPGIPLGTWTVPIAQTPGLTISADQTGAPFSLDGGTVYRSPVTLYLTPGSQHTVTWLTAAPGDSSARYGFESWSDSSTANPRTLTAPSADVTYTGILSAQYRLTLTVSPALAGMPTANPSSADGFYDSGTPVALAATPAAGYVFSSFSGDISAVTPVVVFMDGPLDVTANFACSLAFSYPLPIPAGPGPISGLLAWTLGSACSANLTNDSSWLTLGQPTTFNGLTLVPFSAPENIGAERTATVTITVDQQPWQTLLTQEVAGSVLPNVMSISPASGSGQTAVFTTQTYDAAGYDNINSLNVNFNGTDNLYCTVVILAGQTPSVNVISPGESANGPFPGTGAIGTSLCQIDGAASSISGTGKVRTIALGMTFQTAFGGPRTITAVAGDSASGLSGSLVLLGTWVVPTAPPGLSILKTADAASVAAGSTIGFTIAASNSNAGGAGGAYNTTLTDALPAGGGIDWIVSPPYNGPGICSISGAVGAQTLACSLGVLAPGASTSVHVASATMPVSCRSYSNTATLAADGIVPLTSGVTSVTVVCPALHVSAPASLPQASVDVSYVPITITASGGTGIYTWSATGLPTGLGIDRNTGIISGTPSVAGGPFNVDVKVTDSNSTTADGMYPVTVADFSPCDIDRDGSFTVSDVQQITNEVLGIVNGNHQLAQAGFVSVVDIQISLNAVLTGGCMAR